MNIKTKEKVDVPKGLMLSGVFGTFLLFGFVSALLYSPIIKSNAAEDSANTKVSATIGEVISLTLDTDNLELSVATPTPEGVFTKGTITATTTTNSTGGYELYFSSEDNETDMVHENTVSVK